MKRLLNLSLKSLGALVFTTQMINAQPLHQPIPMYTYDASCGYVGHSRTPSVNVNSGYMEYAIGGIELHNGKHYLCQNVGHADGKTIIVNTKDEINGTSLLLNRFDIGQILGLGASSDYAFDTELDVSLNRLYIVGQSDITGYKGFVLCLDLTTLSPITSFGNMGVLGLGDNPANNILLSSGNNFVVTINTGVDIILQEYTSTGVPTISGIVTMPNFLCSANFDSFKIAPNGHFFVSGTAKNTSNVMIPMFWDLYRTGSAYNYVNSTSPALSPVGDGKYHGFDFYLDPAKVGTKNYDFDLIIVGKRGPTAAGLGIYAKYRIPKITSSFYAPDVTYTNRPSLPGYSDASNDPSAEILFTKCLVNEDGYVTVLGYEKYCGGLGCLTMGYIVPDGSDYVSTYVADSGPLCMTVHKATGLLEDNDGNIIVSGCTTADGYTTIKLSNSYDCMPRVTLEATESVTCPGDDAYLEIGVPSGTPFTVSVQGSAPFYSGQYPISLIVNPTETTVYEIVATDPETGCETVVTHTVVVTQNNPDFNLTISTPNSTYFTMSALAVDQTANTQPGFGFAWSLEELTTGGTVIFSFGNPSCWWIPLSSPNVFSGIDCITYNYSGPSTIATCGVPSVGKFEYDRIYRITRGTWNNQCAWHQVSKIVEVHAVEGGKDENNYRVSITDDPTSPSMLSFDGVVLEEVSIEVYPNPNNGTFNILIKGGSANTIEIKDMAGKVVHRMEPTDGSVVEVNLSDLSKGIYFVGAEINGTIQMQKVIVQ